MSERLGSAAFWGVLVVTLLLLAVLVAGGTNTEPLDPRSTADNGAKGLADLVESFGAEVTLGVSRPDQRHDVAVLLADTYGVADRNALEDWVREGGRLLVADAGSALTPRVDRTGAPDATGSCAVGALSGVVRVVGTRARFRASADGQLCVDGVVAVDTVGAGVIVSIGSPEPLLNQRLDEADNAVLAVGILAPSAGTAVAFLEPRLVGSGGERLVDLVSDPIWTIAVQLGVAFLIIAWWQARRLGSPVDEPSLVEVEGSELAVARGRLLEGMRRPDAAAAELRVDARRGLLRRLGLPADASTDVVAAQLASSVPLTVDELTALLETRPVATDQDLVVLAHGLAQLRRSVSHPDPQPGGAPPPGETT